MPPRLWMAFDTGFLGDHKISELGAEHGPAGPLVMVACFAAAKLQDERGRFQMGYKALARHAYLRSTRQAREIIAHATRLDLLHMLAMDVDGFEGFSPNFERWQLNDPRAAERARRYRDRLRDASVTKRDADHDAERASTRDRHTPTDTDTETEKAKAFSSEVVRLCDLLADLIEANGSKRPTVTEGWRDAARLLVERDERTWDDAERILRWSQADEFWRANVLSMPTFRKRYDQLRLAMERGNVVRLSTSQGAHQRLEEMRRRATKPDGDAA